jgi:RND family efflux transporter MFP subunit
MKNRLRILRELLAATVVLAGCEGCKSHDHPHGDEGHEGAHAPDDDHGEGVHGEEHGHGEGAIGITRFTDKLELFAEHPPAVTGQELTFLAHLTILDGFKALENATVTLVLEGPTRVEAQVTEKLRSGIFQPTLTAPAPGTYRGSLVVAGSAVQDTIDGFEIVVHPNAEAAKQASAGEEEGGAEPITFLKEQQWQIPFATAFATRGSVVPTIEVAGEVTTPPSGQADVGATIAGRVVAPSGGLSRPGQAVRRGEVLATLAPAPAAPESGARADLAVVEAEARVQAARAAVERAERLIADRAISQREVDEARREHRVAEEAVQAAKRARDVFTGAASGRGGGTYRVTAPIDGVVVEVEATAGKSVQSGELLFRLINLDELWIRARVPEQQAAMIRSDQDAAFKLPGLDTWLPLDVTGDNAVASVVNVSRTVDRRSRTVDVIYALRAPDERLRVGAMLRVAVPAGEPWQGVVVPRGAVLNDDGRSVVTVQIEGEAFEERTVRVGPRSGARVGIESGVSANERVVTLGANVVRLSARAGTAPAHGHVH